ncbi:MAG: four helix bundle protein [Dysgonomonas sp.]
MEGFGDFRDLQVYKKGFQQISDIFTMTLSLPKEEKYSLTDQIRRSSRSVCANLAEAYRKREYPKHFLLKITDCMGENSETLVWLDVALDCKYISPENHNCLTELNNEVGKLLMYMYNHSDKFGVSPH